MRPNESKLKNESPNPPNKLEQTDTQILNLSQKKAQTEYLEFLKILKLDFVKRWEQTGVIPPNTKSTIMDFERIKTLGVGSFGRVILTKYIKNNSYYAMKVLSKAHVVKHKQIQHSFHEKRILQSIRYPFLINLEFFFQDKYNIYFIMPFLTGGDLYSYLRRVGKLNENSAKFYAAQVVLALEYLHFMSCIYRDLKPENILLDRNGFIKLADFGFGKLMEEGRTYTLCGTPEYLAPELILSKGHGSAADWWSYGVFIYELVAGHTPFVCDRPIKIYEKITSGQYKMSNWFSNDLKDLVFNILQIDLSKRYGNLKRGAADIKEHHWFINIQWIDMLNRKIMAPFVPPFNSAGDATNYDTYDEKSLTYDLGNIGFSEQFNSF